MSDPLADLVESFSAALLKKLRKAEEEYGHNDAWLRRDWEADCQRHLLEHLAKGDPRDVAAYAAFCWYHGWRTVAPPWPSDGEMLDLLVAAGYDADEVHPKCYRAFGWKTFTEKLRAVALSSADRGSV